MTVEILVMIPSRPPFHLARCTMVLAIYSEFEALHECPVLTFIILVS